MMMTSAVRAVAMYGATALALVGIVAVWMRWRARGRAAGRLPGAAVIGRPAWRNAVSRWTPIAAIPLGLAIAYWVKGHSIEVLLVVDGDGGPRVERKLARHIDAPVVDGSLAVSEDDFLPPSWVVNRSTRTVRVETVQYGGLGDPKRDEPVLLPPGTAGAFHQIEYVGPRDSPPQQAMVMRVLGVDFRYWLTWDP